MTEYSLLACSSGICFLLPSRTTCPRAVSPGELDLSTSVVSQENALQTSTWSWGTADVLTALLVGIQKPVKGRFPSCGLSRGSVKSFQLIQSLKDGIVLSQRWPAHLDATCKLGGLPPALVFIITSQSEMFNIESWSTKLVDQAVVVSITHHGQLCLKKNHLSCLFCPPPLPSSSWEDTWNSRFFLVGLPDRVRPQVCSLSIYGRKWEIRPTYVVYEFPSVEY